MNTFPTKSAADLTPGDVVKIAVGDWRTVAIVATEAGTVRVWWSGHINSTTFPTDQMLTLAQPLYA
ncbi:hypothetical protein [Micromonospora sp. NPDC050695]|uniref:hypothetical protein n=1 Tax=Micromonospora sp. NPDC050695 TaxID=3154938 RepID=UPI003410B0C6